MESSVPIVDLHDDMKEQIFITLDDENLPYVVPVVTLEDETPKQHPLITLETEDDVSKNAEVIIDDLEDVESIYPTLDHNNEPQFTCISSDSDSDFSESIITLDQNDKCSNSDMISGVVNLVSKKISKPAEVTPMSDPEVVEAPEMISIFEPDIVEIPNIIAADNIKVEPSDSNISPTKIKISNLKLQTCKFCHKKFNDAENCTCAKSSINSVKKNHCLDACRGLHNDKCVPKPDKADKPYACDICFKAFGDKNILRMHYNTHTGEKPFACNICDKVFSNTVTLRNHYQTHIGEKPYVCDVCLSSFDEKSSLCDHKLDKHNFLTII